MNDKPVNAVLIVRLSAIGDVIMASGLIGALRARYPHARLAWLVQPEAKDLLAANPALDDVIVWPLGEWRRLARSLRWWRLLREMLAFAAHLRAQRFDIAVDAQGLLKSALWAWLSGARERIGLGSREGSARLMTRVIEKPVGDQRIASEYRHLAAILGSDAGAYRMQLAVSAADERRARELLRARGVGQRYAVVCPFTTRPQKHWFESSWIELVRRLHKELALPAVMLGGPGDRIAAARIAADGPALNVVGETSLGEAVALIRGAALLVGVDTGLTHAGSALEVPTLALFGSTFPYAHADSARTQVLYHKLECSPCRRHPTCNGAYTCMRLITPDEALAQARRLLA
jgi:heptosyltransferase-1